MQQLPFALLHSLHSAVASSQLSQWSLEVQGGSHWAPHHGCRHGEVFDAQQFPPCCGAGCEGWVESGTKPESGKCWASTGDMQHVLGTTVPVGEGAEQAHLDLLPVSLPHRSLARTSCQW